MRRNMSYPKVKEVQADVVLEYTCPEKNEFVTVRQPNLVHEGGCSCHGNDGYCYCPSNEFIADFECPLCGNIHKARLY